ncbi:type II toxin-antitoxin system HicB family antitoxin [Candidatus Acetothermia bacterium]|jgi:predicted RNase H-like HicB family nuclease|nr:type II toxin-antitoxin system HicB family antitoxin [Candidatus Acetothermia bacterium]MCI2432427.1 type II toxin-antitoxin system HicB family antitoxin [Candidatus Acetothermia bacterium]MCI2436316.1 type II toxin-antitoxin system HicB family antitoxin [Candidatus Acetothermia bacterium]
MPQRFTLEYWTDDDWYVGRLREVPSVFSQGETLADLEENIRDAYRLMLEEQLPQRRDVRSKPITVDV